MMLLEEFMIEGWALTLLLDCCVIVLGIAGLLGTPLFHFVKGAF